MKLTVHTIRFEAMKYGRAGTLTESLRRTVGAE